MTSPTKRISSAAATLLLVSLLFGCAADTHERLAADNVATMKQLSATLERITDEKSARKAKSSVASLAKKLENIGDRDAKLPAATPDEAQAINSKYGQQTTELEQKITNQIMRISVDPKLAGAVAGN